MPDFDRLNLSVAEKVALRDRAGVTRLFDGLDLAEPGVVRPQAAGGLAQATDRVGTKCSEA